MSNIPQDKQLPGSPLSGAKVWKRDANGSPRDTKVAISAMYAALSHENPEIAVHWAIISIALALHNEQAVIRTIED